MVAVSQSHELDQDAHHFLRSLELDEEITLLHGDICRLNDLSDVLSSANRGQLTFDVIFARNVLDPIPVDLRAATLLHWATYLTPGSGRIVVTFSPGADTWVEIAGLLIINGKGKARLGFRCMDETEWTRGEEAFGAIASAANLYLAEMQRVGFDGSDAYEEWEGWDPVLKDCVQLHYQEFSERNDLKPAWTDQAGGFSPLFKAMVLKSMMPFLKSDLIAAFGGEDEGFKLDVQPCAVTFAGVIS